jgi:hypothetical protein
MLCSHGGGIGANGFRAETASSAQYIWDYLVSCITTAKQLPFILLKRADHMVRFNFCRPETRILQCVAIIRAVVRFEKLLKSTIFVGISHGIPTYLPTYPTDQGLALELALKRTKARENGTICNFFESFDCTIYCNALYDGIHTGR